MSHQTLAQSSITEPTNKTSQKPEEHLGYISPPPAPAPKKTRVRKQTADIVPRSRHWPASDRKSGRAPVRGRYGDKKRSGKRDSGRSR